jgi:hypothetical protein
MPIWRIYIGPDTYRTTLLFSDAYYLGKHNGCAPVSQSVVYCTVLFRDVQRVLDP